MHAFDPEIVNDFLTESGELLEQFDADLVALESTPRDPDLLNKVFRALHTIKGSASFLALTEIVAIAHAAEDALNVARRGEVTIDRAMMDMLLEAVDLLKRQFRELESGSPLTAPPESLVQRLRAVCGAGSSTPEDGTQTKAPEGQPGTDGENATTSSDGRRPLTLSASKMSLLEFMLSDLEESLDELELHLNRLFNRSSPAPEHDAAHIGDLCDALTKSAEFFEFEAMRSLIVTLGAASERCMDISEACRSQLMPRLLAVLMLLRRQATEMADGSEVWWSVDSLSGNIADLILGHELDPSLALPQGADGAAALLMDGVDIASGDAASSRLPAAEPASAASGRTCSMEAIESGNPADDTAAKDSRPGGDAGAGKPKVEQTIRVEVSRLESLLNLVGELVLQKNRIGALARQVMESDHLAPEPRDALGQSSGDLDRVTGEIQLAVMRTRMQPLDKLFGKYPRLIRDLSRKTNKKIELEILGGDTEVDRSVIEELGDPLVHILRNSADHGIEPPAERAAAGKQEKGTIRLVASQAGDHVLVQIIDDGRGLDRQKLLAKAIEKGMTTHAEADNLSDRDVFRFIFAAGFSTACVVSDLSGRGVGMDVVRTNIEKLKGVVDVDSAPAKGTTIQIRIPLTVAIMPAMLVGVDRELYAVPLSNIVEIVRPEQADISTINGRRVMRLRNGVLPLVSLSQLFQTPEELREEAKFAVVIELNEQRVGLLVSQLIGQREVVIKPLDSGYSGGAPISGATVRDDGGVSLIVDVAKVLSTAQRSLGAAVAA